MTPETLPQITRLGYSRAMSSRRSLLLLVLVVGLRFLSQAWDVGDVFPHPDERQVAFASERAAGWFVDPEFYAYGALHFQAVRGTAFVLGLPARYGGLMVAGRTLSMLASILALLLAWWAARKAWGRRTADLVLLLGAWVPLDLQQSHYGTVEAHHALWVVVALVACFRLATRPSTWIAILAGGAVGASLAVKVSSLALGLPLGLACILAAGWRPLGLARWTTTAAAAVVAAFWLCQPTAFEGSWPPLALIASLAVVAVLVTLSMRNHQVAIRRSALAGAVVTAIVAATIAVTTVSPLLGGGGAKRLPWVLSLARSLGPTLAQPYLRGVGEQVAMVGGRADLPYVRVYADTLPILYPLRELGLWGLGPLLLVGLLIAGWIGLRVLGRRWRRLLAARPGDGTVLLLVILAWLVPMALRLATLQVKFLRYWQPLVVPSVLLVAWAVMRLPKRIRRRAMTAVVAGTAVWGVAFLWAFADPHPHATAATWLSPLVTADQTIAFEHWDETLSLRIDDGNSRRVELPSYELPDNDLKVTTWLEALSQADWVVLTSNRVRRTVLANPDRFPRTGRLYRLLLAGEAGFEPIARVDRSPRLFGLRWPVQRADESFVNYDFPRVVILRRTGPVDVAALAARVERPLPFLEGLDMNALERSFVATLQAVTPRASGVRQVLDVGSWILVFAVWGVMAWLLLLPWLSSAPDAGIGLAVVTGWITASWTLWIGSELGLWPVGPATISWLTVVAAVATAVVVTRGRGRFAVALLRRRWRGVVTVLVVGAAVWGLFLAIRATNPAIHWGEKPMDMSFLQAFLRADTWPTGEPWMAGMPLHYYYFGEVLAATPILATGCSAGVGYNLMAATVPALSAMLLAGLGLAIARRRRRLAAWLAPLLVLLTGNLAWPWLVPMAWQRTASWLDLGHVGWFDMWWATSRVIPGAGAIDEYPLWTALFADLHGHFLALPVLLVTLLWGWRAVVLPRPRWLVAGGMCALGAAVLIATNPWDVFVLAGALGIGTVAAGRRPFAGLGRLALAGSLSVVAGLPFVFELVEGVGAGAGGSRMLFLTAADFAPAWAVLRHFGVFLLPLGAAVGLRLGREWRLAAPLAAVGVILGLGIHSGAAAFGLAVAALFLVAVGCSRDPLERLAWAVAGFGMLLVAACERFTLIDRMNTVFKLYNGVWVLLAVALTLLLLRSDRRLQRVLLAVWLPLEVVALVNLPLGITQGLVEPRMESPTPTLDGQAFLAAKDPDTWFFVRALQGAATPGQVVAEAAGNAYSSFTRIAMHTGQPTVVGWPYHLQQRGQSRAEVDARYADLETLYAGSDDIARRRVLDRYRVAWVVVGAVERTAYELEGPDPLASIPGVEVFSRHGASVLYRVLPRAAAWSPAGTSSAVPGRVLPPGFTSAGRLDLMSAPVISDLVLEPTAAVAITADGRLVVVASDGGSAELRGAPVCRLASVAESSAGELWLGCRDGRLWRRGDRGWTAAGRLPDGADGGLAAADLVWAWGGGGLWRRGRDDRWLEQAPGPVVAAAATRDGIAYSDGDSVRLLRSGGRPGEVGSVRRGVRQLAWLGPVLWLLDDDGLVRSPGAVLPWIGVSDDPLPGARMAGSDDRLWLVTATGELAQVTRPRCRSPFSATAAAGAAGLHQPRGLAVAAEGWFVVADTLNQRLRWYAPDGACLDERGSEGTAPGTFKEPSGVAIAADGSVAVTDTWNGRVQVLAADGEVRVVGADMYGPRGVVWAPDGSLWIADTGNRRLLHASSPGWQPREVATFDGPVVGLAWVGDQLAVAIPAAGRVELVDPGSGTVTASLDMPGWAGGEQQEGYVAMLPDGDLLASAPAAGELWRLDPTGTRPSRLVRGDLVGLTGLAVGPGGRVLGALTWQDRLVDLGRIQ